MEALRGLMAQRDALEREMGEIAELLDASNMGGVSGPLVDTEGYPRADIDVHATRTMRHRLACLNTDHKELMGQIERGLWAVHADAAASGSSRTAAGANGSAAGSNGTARGGAAAAPTGATDVVSASSVTAGERSAAPGARNGHDSLPTSNCHAPAMNGCDGNADVAAVPFALVESVAGAGPASAAGLMVGDQVLRFGTVHAGNHDQLRSLARLTQRSEGGSIDLIVRRAAEPVSLTLVPQRWSGPGLLGCHLTPLA